MFENAIKNLKQDSRLDVKDKDTLQLLREYYRKVIREKIAESKKNVRNKDDERI